MVQIITYPDKRLTQKSEPVVFFDDDVERVARNLQRILAHCNAFGLSAPQLGVHRRIIAVTNPDGDGSLVVVNPEITSFDGSELDDEGCLSIPDAYFKIYRPNKLVINGRNIFGEEVTINAEGYAARAFAHEIDHLDGILIWNRLLPEPRKAAIDAFAHLSQKTR